MTFKITSAKSHLTRAKAQLTQAKAQLTQAKAQLTQAKAQLNGQAMLSLLCSEPGRSAVYYASIIGVRPDQCNACLHFLRGKMLVHCEKKRVEDALDGKLVYLLTFYFPTEKGKDTNAGLIVGRSAVAASEAPGVKKLTKAYRASWWRALWELLLGGNLYSRRSGGNLYSRRKDMK
jgi:hypothetical protein